MPEAARTTDARALEPLLSVDEAAGILGISPRYLRARIAAGDVRAVRFGRRVLLAPEEVRGFIRRETR